MFSRRSLRFTVTLGVVMILLLIVLTVGWVFLAALGALADSRYAGLYWALLSVGTSFILLLLIGVVVYLALTIKAINLNRRQANFIDSVTHELKSPIATMKLYLQTLDRQNVARREREDFYRAMLVEVDRLDQLTSHILEAGRLDERIHPTDVEDVELADLLRETVQMVSCRYRLSPESIDVDLAPCVVRARRIDLQMLFRNVIDNAVKYGGPDPEVTVSLHGSDGWTVTRVCDSGPGIPRKQRRKIFGRFVRLGVELERKQSGMGLGLYIVNTLATRMGGQIAVRDRDEGPGTVFEVRLPAPPEVTPDDPGPAREAPAIK